MLYFLPFGPRTKWPKNARTGVLDITSYKKIKYTKDGPKIFVIKPGLALSLFLYEIMFKMFLAGNCKGSHFEFFAKIVVRGNAVQNFPAKSLSKNIG